MNYRIVSHILGNVTALLGGFMLIPLVIAFFSAETAVVWSFLWTILISAAVSALLLLAGRHRKTLFFAKEGFITVGLSWLLVSLLGALPFYFSGAIPSFIDCLFESVSGFTTTGGSILNDVESLPGSLLFWRSFSHWIGGMGILVFVLSVVSLAGGNSTYLMRAEVPHPGNSKLAPKIKETAKVLYLIYLVLTAVLFLFLFCGGMSFFESINHALSIAGTGGFAVKNDSMMGYSPFLQWVMTVFMLIFSINFNVYYLLLLKRFKAALRFEEMLVYIGLVIVFVVMITAGVWQTVSDSFGESVRLAAFQVASIFSTTGFYTADFSQWPQICIVLLMAAMFIGGCTGSTAGGAKIMRLMVLIKSLRRDARKLIHRKAVECVEICGKPMDEHAIKGVNSYFYILFIVFAVSIVLIAFQNLDFTTTFSAVLSSISNVGPGFSLVSPVENYGFLSSFSKGVLIFDMLAGRLGIFPVLLLFFPSVWHRAKNI